ncbi:MAG: hypothetical protein PF518_04835 [Spirochaetaceae bacterium]|jgi:hypothetical protein|nr:hypothetical protein [Spirochaetaceae bacterium]
MGQWRFQITFLPGIGFYVTFTRQEITIALPFITMYIGLTKSARGFDFFNKWRNY